jgi:DNA polymerase I
MKHLVIIDGHHLMYRAYWAIPRTLKTRAGEQVNAVFGVASMLLTILKKEEPDAFLMCFDKGEDTFRHQENATYKDGRAETPDDFYTQIPRIFQLVDALKFPQVSDAKYEADDFLCTYAMAAEKAGMRVTIVTGDRDAFQLANENVRIAIPHSGYQAAEYLGPAEIEAKYGIRPDQVPAYKGLIGDSSDNLPGVRGIGPKTAAELLQKYQTLEAIYENLAEIRPKVREKLEADKEQAFFCQHMALLICDIALPVPIADLMLDGKNIDACIEFFQEMEFSLLTRRFREFLSTPYGSRAFQASPAVLPPVKGVPPKEQLSLF